MQRTNNRIKCTNCPQTQQKEEFEDTKGVIEIYM
jgi:hypothetical protein